MSRAARDPDDPGHTGGDGDAGPGDERVEVTGGVLLPGGKVDPDALRRIIEAQRAERVEGGLEAGDDDEAVGRVTFTLQRDLKSRLDKYLTSRITFMSRNQLQKLIAGGGVMVNDRPGKPSTTLRRGDVVEVMIPEPPPQGIQPEDIPLEVLHEDEHLIVINKSPDIIVHPARSHLRGTMVNALAGYFARTGAGSLSRVGDELARPGVVHRLDRHTSGVIVFAKREEAHWKLGHQFEHRRVDKRYLALVHGRIEPDGDVIELPIGPHPSREKGFREKYVVRHDDQGKHAVTIWRVRERYELRVPNGVGGVIERAAPHSSLRARRGAELVEWFTLVELELKTGRTHQIRVHLSHMGWPIVGDDMYGGRPLVIGQATEPRVVIGRQALHAAVLGFTHPVSGAPMRFIAPLRGDMAEAVALLRSHAKVDRPQVGGVGVDLASAVAAVGESRT